MDNKTFELGDAPIEAQYAIQMQAIAGTLDEVFNGKGKGSDHKTGFVLLVFPFGDTGRCNFISNGGNRKDIVALFKAMIARVEGQPEMKGSA
jgi:hypothetical protein